MFSYEINWCLWVLSGLMDSNNKRIAFFRIFGFLQKTLVARISAPRRGTEAVQYSKLSSGGPLCSQTSSSPWEGIRRAPEPQKWARSKFLKNSKFYPFGPKNPFFRVQKAENGCRTSMSPIIHWKYAIGGENWWNNQQKYHLDRIRKALIIILAFYQLHNLINSQHWKH